MSVRVLIDEARARANIKRMADKARAADVRLRPHVKTHQSVTIAGWLRDEGVDGITVSNIGMAEAFAADGWRDITLAVPMNPNELPRCRELAENGVTLGLLADHPETAAAIAAAGAFDLWLKIDVGYGRAGVRWDDAPRLEALAQAAAALPADRTFGILTHAGHSYAASGPDAVLRIHRESLERMALAREAVQATTGRAPRVSVGDTPTCSLADTFPGADEIRPGNFVLYDLMQKRIGACRVEDIALHVEAPVVGLRPDTHRLVLHCGAVHLSKDMVRDAVGETVYAVAVRDDGALDGSRRLVHLSQEHGLLTADPDTLEHVRPGDTVRLAPVHACLVCDLNRDLTFV